MKKLLIALAAVLVTVASYGQGTVVLSNLGGGVNAPVLLGDTGHGPGPDYTAQLFLSSGGTLTALTPATSFRPAGVGAQAIADRYTVTPSPILEVPGVAAGASATFVLRAWKTSLGTADAAKAAGQLGESAPVAIAALGGGLNPPANLVGLAGFTVPVPEPTIIALGVLGASALFLRRRS